MSTSTAAGRGAPDTGPPAAGDERLSSRHRLAGVLRRPEIGAFAGALVIFLFFTFRTDSFFEPAGASTWIFNASTIGIMAVAVALLMIGGEFDLSAGAMIGTTGLTTGILMSEYDVNVWLAILAALVLAVAIGALNGLVVMWTRLPSFIVTLGTFFVLQGVNLAVTKILIGKVSVTGLQDAAGYYDGKQLFGSFVNLDMAWVPWLEANDAKTTLTLYAATFWFVGVTVAATWVLQRTRSGNWIFAVGGAQTSARQVGVPVLRTKVGLFITTAVAGWLVGMLQLFKTTTVQSTTGVGQEFIFIICAVVGGCLLTGGYGSAVGAALGALIYGMVQQGIPQAGWDNDWLYAFLGVMLLGAVLVNNWVKNRAESI
ncbi:ABC transporter permease [Nocardioides mesophilus]|uniref:Xylose transport system permease protein XylH n=1 Tax=Nocardioides mesophilus TaxID=433659 RepID=A0A7G9RDT6_9ACTN|nr:ABC transporter permease [Nocardioides mesophilus]QNN53761.1 ABC transporter permease [Nocardioides mesophilus]